MAPAAYQLLRKLGIKPAIARHFLIELRKKGFVIVKEKQIKMAAKINLQIETIIKLMKAKRGKK